MGRRRVVAGKRLPRGFHLVGAQVVRLPTAIGTTARNVPNQGGRVHFGRGQHFAVARKAETRDPVAGKAGNSGGVLKRLGKMNPLLPRRYFQELNSFRPDDYQQFSVRRKGNRLVYVVRGWKTLAFSPVATSHR